MKGGKREIVVDSVKHPSYNILIYQQDDQRYPIVEYLRNGTQVEGNNEMGTHCLKGRVKSSFYGEKSHQQEKKYMVSTREEGIQQQSHPDGILLAHNLEGCQGLQSRPLTCGALILQTCFPSQQIRLSSSQQITSLNRSRLSQFPQWHNRKHGNHLHTHVFHNIQSPEDLSI